MSGYMVCDDADPDVIHAGPLSVEELVVWLPGFLEGYGGWVVIRPADEDDLAPLRVALRMVRDSLGRGCLVHGAGDLFAAADAIEQVSEPRSEAAK